VNSIVEPKLGNGHALYNVETAGAFYWMSKMSGCDSLMRYEGGISETLVSWKCVEVHLSD
jgi:hypothetical protein